jgi:hypothetical protein
MPLLTITKGASTVFDRGYCKANAKADLRGFYWLSLAVCLVSILLIGGISGYFDVELTAAERLEYQLRLPLIGSLPVLTVNFSHPWRLLLPGAALGLCFGVFVSGPVRVGRRRFFVHADNRDRAFGTLFSSFRRGRYLSAVKGMFMTDLFIFFWSLLFLIPGIVKGYQYRMVPYILSDHPDMHYRDAQRFSRELTEGKKGKMFVLDLSFSGWLLLGALAFGLGVWFVYPYIDATWAQAYRAMRAGYLRGGAYLGGRYRRV